MTLSIRSEAKLLGVHADLVKVVRKAAENCSFVVVEGLRTLEKQREYYDAGKSKTMNSRHLTGHAVDLMPYGDFDGDGDREGSWEVINFIPVINAMKDAAIACDVPLVFGGEWKDFKDWPHCELARSKYP